MTKHTPLEAAEHALKREQARLVEVNAKLEEITAEIEKTDPDATRFADLIAAKATCVARAEAMEQRIAKAAWEVEDAREAAEREAKAVLQQQLDGVERELEHAETEIVERVLEFRRELADAVRLQRERLARLVMLEVRLGQTPVRDRFFFANFAGEELRAAWLHPAAQAASARAAVEARVAAAAGR